MKKFLLYVGLPLLFFLFLVFIFIALPALRLYSSVNNLKKSLTDVPQLIKSQDLPAVQGRLVTAQTNLTVVQKDFSRFSWVRFVPFAQNYYFDGNHGLKAAGEMFSAASIAVDAIAPYADVIGLKGLYTTGDGVKTTQDRITVLINTLDKIKPQISQISTHLTAARTEIDQIDPRRYPARFKLATAITLLDQSSNLISEAQPLLDAAPYMLGIDKPRQYLMIFQNDAELRPTGGFMTAYTILSVDKGKISTELSGDIYSLDAQLPNRIPAPAPILKYLPNVPYWNLRDQNLSPDFKVSMDTFLSNYNKTKSPKVDGIIAVDTQVLVNLLKVLGPLNVPNFGTYTADTDKRCNCPQVFYELELFADVEGPVVWDTVTGQIVYQPKNYGDRKAFIGPMMYAMLTKIMSQPQSKLGELFNAFMATLQSKDILFYYPDPKIQAAVESFNLAGRVRATDNDYLMIVDTNFAGAKTNAWVTYAADHQVKISEDGTVTKTLTLTYKNPQAYFEDPKTKLKLNGIFRDWLRVYVPQGSKLVEAKGFETGQATNEDLGKTVFEGFFTLTPLNVKTITISYQLPFKVKSPYQLLIQKQPGAKYFNHKISINGKSIPEFSLSADKELSLPY